MALTGGLNIGRDHSYQMLLQMGVKGEKNPPENRIFSMCLTIKLYLFQENMLKT